MAEEIVRQEPTSNLARVHVFATSGEQMQQASAELSAWFARRLNQEKAELAQLEQNLAEAKKHKWKTSSWTAAISKAKGAVAYFERAKQAVDEGYTIVPDMNADWFAIRTTRENPPRNEKTDLFNEPSMATLDLPPSPAGEGNYVDVLAEGTYAQYKNEKDQTRYTGWSTGFREWTFPVTFVRPEIVKATTRAMELKIFDAFGLVGGRRKDPMIVAVIKAPKSGWVRKEMHFIIGWFLDTRTL